MRTNVPAALDAMGQPPVDWIMSSRAPIGASPKVSRAQLTRNLHEGVGADDARQVSRITRIHTNLIRDDLLTGWRRGNSWRAGVGARAADC